MFDYFWCWIIFDVWWTVVRFTFIFIHLFYDVKTRKRIERNKSRGKGQRCAREQNHRVKRTLTTTCWSFKRRRLKQDFSHIQMRENPSHGYIEWEPQSDVSNNFNYTQLSFLHHNNLNILFWGAICLTILQVFIFFLILLLIDSFRNLPKFHFCLCLKTLEVF